MSSTEPIQIPENTASYLRMQILMENVRRKRHTENWANAGKFFFAYIAILFVAWLLAAMFEVAEPVEAAWIVLTFGVGLVVMLVDIVFNSLVCFVPFLLYFWAEIWQVRRRTLTALIQAAIETKTPLSTLVRAYACDCYSPWFRRRLERFAAILEQGYPLNQAVEWDRGLFRYDTVGTICLSGGDPAAIGATENPVREEGDDSSIRGMSAVRLVYFFAILTFFLPVVSFLMYAIVPKFEAIFIDFDTELPAMTVCVIRLSNVFINYFYLFFQAFLLLGALLIVLFIMRTNLVVWRPPFFRWMFRDTDSSRMLRMLSAGLKYNVSIPKILHVYRLIVPNSYLRRQAARMEQGIEQGRDWIETLKKRRMVDGPEASLLETARRTGNTASVLEQLAASKELAQLRKDDLTSKLVFIPSLLGLGLVVGFFVIAMFLPLIKLITMLSG